MKKVILTTALMGIGLSVSPCYPVKPVEFNFYRASKKDRPHHAKKSRGFSGYQ